MTSQPQSEPDLDEFMQFLRAEDDSSVSEPDDISNFEQFLRKPEPGILENATEAAKETFRFNTRNLSTAAASIAGIPGNTVQFAKWISSKLPDVPEFLKGDDTFVSSFGRNVLENIPTTEDIKQFNSRLTDGFVDPQNAIEEFGDEVLDLGVTLSVGNKDPSKLNKLINPITKAFAAKAARVGAEQLGAGEGGQAATEMGIITLMSLFDQKFASKYISEKYKSARSKLPENLMVNTFDLTNELEALETELSKGISTASKNEVRTALNELKAKASGGAIPADELIQTYHDINERMTSKRLFDDLSKSERRSLKHRYDNLRKAVGNNLNKLEENFPEFISEWREANQGFGTIAQSRKASNWVQSISKKLPKALAFGVAHTLFNPSAAIGLTGGAAALKTSELIYRIAKSPTLRKHYLNTLQSALNENTAGYIKNLGQLEKGLKDEFGSEFFVNENDKLEN